VEPVFCPNGHPNRPGTRICAVCRALILPSRPGATASPAPPAKPTASPVKPTASPAGRPAAPATRQGSPSPAPPRSGIGYGLPALLLLLLVVAGLAVLALRYPLRRADYLATAAVVTLPAGAAVVALPTATPAATPTPPPPTATPPPAPTADPNAPPTPVATITPLATIVGIILAPAPDAAPVAGANLVQNGDFSQDWANGWERTTEGLNGVQVVETRAASGDPPQPSLYLSKSGAGALRIVQHVTLSGAAADLVFRGQLRLSGALDGAGNEGRAALLLLYEDADGETLGTSAWLDGSANGSGLWGTLLPTFGPTTAPRFQAPGWQPIEIALGREFADRLPDLDPAVVRRVTIVLALLGGPGCAPDACAAELEAAALSLSAAESAP